jgi:hypothetical protein
MSREILLLHGRKCGTACSETVCYLLLVKIGAPVDPPSGMSKFIVRKDSVEIAIKFLGVKMEET